MNNPKITSQSGDRKNKKTTRFIAVVVFVTLGLIYTLIYSGNFTTDDEHILASQALSIAFDSHFNIDRVLGNTRVFALSRLSSQQAVEAENIEPALSWLGSSMAKISVLLGIGHIQILFLLNIWITALTGMVLFLATQDMGYQRRTGFILAGLFGLGTIALPYSKTYFRDPLAALLLLCAWMFAYRIRAAGNETGMKKARLFSWLGIVGFSIAGILAKNTVLIAIPVMLVIIFARKSRSPGVMNPKYHWRIWIIAGCCLAVLLLVWFLIVPRVPSLARFTPKYYESLIKYFFSTPRTNIVQALVGPFVSPGKSIFLFSPVLLISLASLVFQFKKSWMAWLYLLLLVMFQALFYDADWAGQVNWGLRFTLPAVPLLLLAAAPIVERILKFRIWKVFVGFIAAISIFIQFLGAIVPTKQYFVEKAAAVPPISETDLTWQGSQSIFLWSMQRFYSGGDPDLAIWRNPVGLVAILPGMLAIGVMILFALQKQKRYWLAGLAVGLLILIDLTLMGLYKNDMLYFKTRNDFEQSQKYLLANIVQGDAVIIKSYGASDWSYWMNWGNQEIHWVSLPFSFPTLDQITRFNQSGQPQDVLDPNSLAILDSTFTSGTQVWFLFASDSPGGNLGIEELWLTDRSQSRDCEIFENVSTTTTLCMFKK